MVKYSRVGLFPLIFFTLLTGNDLAISGGFMIPHQTARALSLSNAMTAGVDDASAVYYNPAALSEVVGNNLLLNGIYVGVVSSVENSGREAVNKHDDNFLASLFANYHIPGTDITVGIGTYTPFGLATTYERDFTRFAANRTELRTLYDMSHQRCRGIPRRFCPLAPASVSSMRQACSPALFVLTLRLVRSRLEQQKHTCV